MLSTYPTSPPSESSSSKSSPAPIAPPPSEGSVDWQANLQAIQNLMGALYVFCSCIHLFICLTTFRSLRSDAYDLVSPLTPYLTHRSSHTSLLLVLTLLSLLFSLPVLPLIPLRPLFFVLGVLPFAWTHPFTQSRVIPLLKSGAINRAMTKGSNAGSTLAGLTCAKYALLKMRLRRWIDDDRLEDRHWNAEMREVELWENERWTPGYGPLSSSQVVQDDFDKDGVGSVSGMDSVVGTGSAFSATNTGTWSKSHLRPADRAPWTRGRDGWSGVGGEVRCVCSWFRLIARLLRLAGRSARNPNGQIVRAAVILIYIHLSSCIANPLTPSSNLTFSLAPGWTFVETEGWRPDAVGSWVCAGGDPVCRSDESESPAVPFSILFPFLMDNRWVGVHE